MAALCQNHRAGLLRASPVTSDKAVCLMEVTDILVRRDIANLTELSAFDDFLHRLIKGAIAEDMADGHDLVALVRLSLKLDALGNIRRNRLFGHDMVASFQRLERLWNVLSVLGADEHQICQFGVLEHFLCAVKAHLIRQTEPLFGCCNLFRDNIRYRNHLHAFRMLEGILGIALSSQAISRYRNGNYLFHLISSLSKSSCHLIPRQSRAGILFPE